MNTDTITHTQKEHHNLKLKMLNWANRFSIFCFLDNNGYSFEHPAFECLLGAGCVRSFEFTGQKGFSSFQSFFDASPSWLFGHLGYNAAGNAYIKIKMPDPDFGRGFFFEPEIVLRLSGDKLEVLKSNRDTAQILEEIYNTSAEINKICAVKNIRPVISREEYLKIINALQQHILRGDCYEINFCMQFLSANAYADPIDLYNKLAAISPAPFGAFYKLKDKYCICASPERFLKKKGRHLISQPIKGTGRRDLLSKEKDEAYKRDLQKSSKEKSENVMVVDLVRNDLSVVCEKDSVKVTELFGIYSFPQVHQMISTVEGTLATDKKFTDAIEACYPMGSMTGAPKKKVMELIEEYEANPRGLFSGSLGYITPDGDFDLNVVIRSIFFDSTKHVLSFFAGSGITFYSQKEKEYDECMAKAEAIIKILTESE